MRGCRCGSVVRLIAYHAQSPGVHPCTLHLYRTDVDVNACSHSVCDIKLRDQKFKAILRYFNESEPTAIWDTRDLVSERKRKQKQAKSPHSFAAYTLTVTSQLQLLWLRLPHQDGLYP